MGFLNFYCPSPAGGGLAGCCCAGAGAGIFVGVVEFSICSCMDEPIFRSSELGNEKLAAKHRTTREIANPQVSFSMKSDVFLTPITWLDPIIPETIPPPLGF